jgi:serine/threonine-protein kinase
MSPVPGLGVGSTIGPYRLEDLLGEGATGRVYRAVSLDDGGRVAVKVVKPEVLADPRYAGRFEREARAAAEVASSHLVGVVDFGEAEGRKYLVMPFVEGESLDRRLEREGPLDVAETVRVADEVAEGLDALHAAGLVHRDVKAANILLDADGTATLTDFGLAKGRGDAPLTQPGQVVGTLDYLAPELIRGEPATPASDVYALGCVAYECLAGEPPFGGRSLFEVGLAVLEEMPADPCAARDDAPPGLSAVILEALAKDPDARPARASEFARGLGAAAGLVGS